MANVSAQSFPHLLKLAEPVIMEWDQEIMKIKYIAFRGISGIFCPFPTTKAEMIECRFILGSCLYLLSGHCISHTISYAVCPWTLSPGSAPLLRFQSDALPFCWLVRQHLFSIFVLSAPLHIAPISDSDCRISLVSRLKLPIFIFYSLFFISNKLKFFMIPSLFVTFQEEISLFLFLISNFTTLHLVWILAKWLACLKTLLCNIARY